MSPIWHAIIAIVFFVVGYIFGERTPAKSKMRDVKRTECPICGSIELADRCPVGLGSPLYCLTCGAVECAICWGWHTDMKFIRTCEGGRVGAGGLIRESPPTGG